VRSSEGEDTSQNADKKLQNLSEEKPSLRIYFATTNKNKLDEAKKILNNFDIELEMLPEKKREIQSDRLEEIAEVSAREIAETLKIHVVTEDSGMFVQDLNGFPGPYSAYTFKTIGCRGILDLMRDRMDRTARFEAVVAYCGWMQTAKSFVGFVQGNLSREARGKNGFGFDPIFIPSEGDGRTFAEMPLEKKNLYSHRARAFRKFGEWFQSHRRSLK
jgi:XTP/dITP diphosphohydrolase